jgi:hypothetical protein
MRYEPLQGAWLKEAASVTHSKSEQVPHRIGHIGTADITHWQHCG